MAEKFNIYDIPPDLIDDDQLRFVMESYAERFQVQELLIENYKRRNKNNIKRAKELAGRMVYMKNCLNETRAYRDKKIKTKRAEIRRLEKRVNFMFKMLGKNQKQKLQELDKRNG